MLGLNAISHNYIINIPLYISQDHTPRVKKNLDRTGIYKSRMKLIKLYE